MIGALVTLEMKLLLSGQPATPGAYPHKKSSGRVDTFASFDERQRYVNAGNSFLAAAAVFIFSNNELIADILIQCTRAESSSAATTLSSSLGVRLFLTGVPCVQRGCR